MNIELGPPIIHPEQESAVGSRNSLIREGRDQYQEDKLLVDEGVDKVLNHISAKLPPEVLSKVDVMSSIKEKLHNYYNISYQNMYNRYLTTVEDELSKKYRDLVSKEEYKGLNKYSPRLISDILLNIGGLPKFNTREMERSIINIFGHLQGAIQREAFGLETNTNAILRQKIDVGAFVRGENTYAIAKCSIKSNKQKPRTVSDYKLAINVLDSELISFISHYHQNLSVLLRKLASDEIMSVLEERIERLNQDLIDSGKEELSGNEAIIKKISFLDKYFDVGGNMDHSTLIQQHILDVIDEVPKSVSEIDPISLRENIARVMTEDGLLNRGYNTAVNLLTSVLDTSKLSYQHVENNKNYRRCIIREYHDMDLDQLPDERYMLTLSYYDEEQIKGMRKNYEQKFRIFRKELSTALSILEERYSIFKKETDVIDYSDVLQKTIEENRESEGSESFFDKFLKKKTNDTNTKKKVIAEDDVDDKIWNEFRFVRPHEKESIYQYKKFDSEVQELKEKLIHMHNRIQEVYGRSYPTERIIIEEKIDQITDRFNKFNNQVNPFQLQAGICLEIDITSVKKRLTTVMSIANVINEFLHATSKGFSDSAFANFQRRRSTIKDDDENVFSSHAM